MTYISFSRCCRLRIVTAGLFACMSTQTGILMAQSSAQSSTWSAPASGFVFDAAAAAIRPVSGFVGSATSGPAIMSGVQWAAVAPNQKAALVSRDSVLLFVPNLNVPDQSQTVGSITDARQALWAADSSRAVILSGDEIIWLNCSNSVTAIGGRWRVWLGAKAPH